MRLTLRLQRPYHLGWRDPLALAPVFGVMILVGLGARGMVGPLVGAHQPRISLPPSALPGYALRTTLRMFAALAASLLFTLYVCDRRSKKPPGRDGPRPVARRHAVGPDSRLPFRID
jgi:hypothetical protein